MTKEELKGMSLEELRELGWEMGLVNNPIDELIEAILKKQKKTTDKE